MHFTFYFRRRLRDTCFDTILFQIFLTRIIDKKKISNAYENTESSIIITLLYNPDRHPQFEERQAFNDVIAMNSV